MIPHWDVANFEASQTVCLQKAPWQGLVVEAQVLGREKAENRASPLDLRFIQPHFHDFLGNRGVAPEVIAGTSAGEELGGNFDADHCRKMHLEFGPGNLVRIWARLDGLGVCLCQSFTPGSAHASASRPASRQTDCAGQRCSPVHCGSRSWGQPSTSAGFGPGAEGPSVAGSTWATASHSNGQSTGAEWACLAPPRFPPGVFRQASAPSPDSGCWSPKWSCPHSQEYRVQSHCSSTNAKTASHKASV